jgi:hypothetical protein
MTERVREVKEPNGNNATPFTIKFKIQINNKVFRVLFSK